MNNRGKIAIGQILILIISLFAFTWMIGGVYANLELGLTNPKMGLFPAGLGSNPTIPSTGGLINGGVGASARSYLYSKVSLATDAPANAAANVKSPTESKGIFENIKGFITGHPIATAIIVAAIIGGIFVYKNMNEEGKGLTKGVLSAAGWGTTAGIAVGKWLHAGLGWGIGVGSAVGLAYLIFIFKNEKQEIVTFTCYPWQASEGGDKCDLCNRQGLPCSEYQCRSLGQTCELVNPGTSEERCVETNRNDVEYPIIEAWEDALLNGYKYDPKGLVFPSPGERGVKIVYKNSSDGCVPAFTPLSFGVKLDEPARCKIDVLRKEKFDDMAIALSGSLALENHSFTMSLPGSSALTAENITIQNEGEYEVYVRCSDTRGNSNPANFVFKYCVDKGPDTTPPLIVSTSILNNMPIKYEQSDVGGFEIYTNEPAECKWSHLDQSYENMENTFMSCSISVSQINSQLLYTCRTTLTGLNDRTENKFYFRCKDQPTGVAEEDRNTNAESYKFTLIGTQPLYIDNFEPNGTGEIRVSTNSIKVVLKAKTSAGYDEGKSICYYSEDDQENYIQFLNTNSYTHFQDLYLEEGIYKYFIKCVDLGGNEDTVETSFHVESDTEAPVVVRAYYEKNDQARDLKIITNEKSECYYDTTDCNFQIEDGIIFTSVNNLEHFASWNTQSDLFIKCKDEYENQPSTQNACSIVVRATNFQSINL